MYRNQTLLTVCICVAMLTVSACGQNGSATDTPEGDAAVVVDTRPGLLRGEWVEDGSSVRVVLPSNGIQLIDELHEEFAQKNKHY